MREPLNFISNQCAGFRLSLADNASTSILSVTESNNSIAITILFIVSSVALRNYLALRNQLAQYFCNYVSKNFLSAFMSSHTQPGAHSMSYSIFIHMRCLFGTLMVMTLYNFLSLLFRSNSLPCLFVPVLSSIHKFIRQFARCFSQSNFLSPHLSLNTICWY